MPRDNEIKDRARITDHVADVMHSHYRDTSIDRLLTRPLDAIAMALGVGKKSGRLSRADVKALADRIDNLRSVYPDAFEHINEILRTALSSRKRGDLKRDRV